MTPDAHPILSVAMATYNGAAYLDAQLDSIAGQTRLPDELVVADDASRDDSVAIVERFARHAPFPVRILRHPRNIGILENFHSALTAARGDWIFYCDQDDVWHPDKVRRMADHFRPGVMLVTHQSAVVGADLTPEGRTAPGNRRYGRFAFPADSAAIHGFGHQMAIRHPVIALLQNLRTRVETLDPTGFSQDLDRYLPFCASLIGDIVALPDALVQFRRHAAATSPAGSIASGRASLAMRIDFLIARDASRSAEHLRAADAAALPAPLPAFRRKAAIARHQRAIRDATSLRARLVPLSALLWALAHSPAFTNDSRLRTLALALLAAVRFRRR